MRSPLGLSQTEREEISRDLRAGASLHTITVQLRRSPSTLPHEVSANGGRAKRSV